MNNVVSPSSLGGVRAVIKIYSPWVASGADAFGYVDLRSDTGLVATGWIEYDNQERHIFSEWKSGASDHTNPYPADAINSYHTFKVTFDPSTHNTSFWEDGQKLGLTVQLHYGTYYLTEIGSQTYNQATQMPGGSSNHELYYSSELYTPEGSSGDWYDFNGQVQPHKPWARSDPPQGTNGTEALDTWDNACTN